MEYWLPLIPCPGPCLVDLPGHVLEVHLSQIAKVAQILTQETGRQAQVGRGRRLRCEVSAWPRLFSALWPRQTEHEKFWKDGDSCEEALQWALSSLHLTPHHR